MKSLTDNNDDSYDTSGYTSEEVEDALTILKYVSYDTWDTITIVSNRSGLSEMEATFKLGIASIVVDFLLLKPHPFEKTKHGVQTRYKLTKKR